MKKNKIRLHNWTLNDVILALYVEKHGISNLGSNIETILERIGSTKASLEMQGRMIVHIVDGEKGLPHSGFALRYAVDKFRNMPDIELTNYVIRILNKTPNQIDAKNNRTFLMHQRKFRQDRAINKLHY